LEQIPLVGQRTNDKYFVNNIETEMEQLYIYNDIDYVKEYQKISEYININSLQRYYEISEKQSLDRRINKDMFYVFGYSVEEKNKSYGLNQFTDEPYNKNYFATLLLDYFSNRKVNGSVLYCYGYVTSGNVSTLQQVAKIYLNTNSIATGNCINFITDFYDNYSAGNKAIKYTKANNTDGFITKAVRYCDETGYLKYIKILNVTDSNITYSTTANMDEIGVELPDLSNFADNIITTDESNATSLTFCKVGAEQQINLEKDNREIIHINQQFHFLTNDDSVIVGSAMTDKCRFIQNINFTTKFVFLRNPVDNYEFKIKSSDIISSTTITNANITNYLNTITNTGNTEICPNYNADLTLKNVISGLSETAYAWGFLTDDNELIIARNETLNNGDRANSIFMSVTSNYIN
jgi:hypothetical protein